MKTNIEIKNAATESGVQFTVSVNHEGQPTVHNIGMLVASLADLTHFHQTILSVLPFWGVKLEGTDKEKELGSGMARVLVEWENKHGRVNSIGDMLNEIEKAVSDTRKLGAGVKVWRTTLEDDAAAKVKSAYEKTRADNESYCRDFNTRGAEAMQRAAEMTNGMDVIPPHTRDMEGFHTAASSMKAVVEDYDGKSPAQAFEKEFGPGIATPPVTAATFANLCGEQDKREAKARKWEISQKVQRLFEDEFNTSFSYAHFDGFILCRPTGVTARVFIYQDDVGDAPFAAFDPTAGYKKSWVAHLSDSLDVYEPRIVEVLEAVIAEAKRREEINKPKTATQVMEEQNAARMAGSVGMQARDLGLTSEQLKSRMPSVYVTPDASSSYGVHVTKADVVVAAGGYFAARHGETPAEVAAVLRGVADRLEDPDFLGPQGAQGPSCPCGMPDHGGYHGNDANAELQLEAEIRQLETWVDSLRVQGVGITEKAAPSMAGKVGMTYEAAQEMLVIGENAKFIDRECDPDGPGKSFAASENLRRLKEAAKRHGQKKDKPVIRKAATDQFEICHPMSHDDIQKAITWASLELRRGHGDGRPDQIRVVRTNWAECCNGPFMIAFIGYWY